MEIRLLFLFIFYVGGGVLGQQNVRPENFMAAILENDKPICAGTFIHKQYVVTAAKCVYGKRDLKVALGSAKPAENKKKTVTMVHVHPYYRAPTLDYDVALLKVDTRGNENDIETLDLANAEPENVPYITAGAWDSNAADQTFQNEPVYLLTRKECAKAMSGLVAVTGKLICVDNSNSRLPLRDGSPVAAIKDDEHLKNLIGIATKMFNKDRAAAKLPSVFVNMANSEIRAFLQSIVN